MSMFDKIRPARGLGFRFPTDHQKMQTVMTSGFKRRAGLAVALVAASLSLTGCRLGDDLQGALGGGGRAGDYFCPRPPGMPGDNFNDQEQKIRAQRSAAFDGNFFSQLELAAHYRGVKAVDKNIEDPIEASVWLTVALANQSGYAPMSRNTQGEQHYEVCRANERGRAYEQLDDLLSMMDSQERDKVRDRVIYILSTQGADGFRTMARLYDEQYGPMGEPADDRNAVYANMRNKRNGKNNVRRLFQRNDVDAYLYGYKAANTGDISAYVLLKDFESSGKDRKKYSAFVEAKAKRWTAPFEFYPPEPNQPGAPALSDESRRTEAGVRAFARINELPFTHVARALRYLGIAPAGLTRPEEVTPQTLTALRAMVGMPSYSLYSAPRMLGTDSIRAIQLAAIYGDPRSQLVLAVMYSCGIGVPEDNARAFYWYQQSARQGSGEAKYAMATFFSLGLAGVSDQNRAQAVVLRLGSALDGFKPSEDRLRAILEQVARQGQGDIGPRYDPTMLGGYDAVADANAAADTMGGGAVSGEAGPTDQ
jgi:uncharacterized protein